MPYILGPLPQEAPPWMTRELLAIAESQTQPQQTTNYSVVHVEVPRPRAGVFVIADGTNWDPGYGEGPYWFDGTEWQPMFGAGIGDALIVACSDETTALTTGTAKVTFRTPYPLALDEVRASLTTAPTGSTLIVDINESGVSLLSTKLSIDASEKTSTTAASAAVISDAVIANDAEITIDIDQVGSTIAGAGLKVTFIWRRVSSA